jgi:hypothetical protein
MKQKIMIRLALLAEQSGDKVSETRLEFTAEKLFEYGHEKVCAALEKLLESSRRFPTIAEIKTAMGVAEPTGRDLGTHVANLMIQAMGKFGSLNSVKQSTALKLALGDAVWDIVERLGGWNLCCDRAGENISSFVAQTRDLVESYSGTGMLSFEQVPKALPSRQDAWKMAEEKIALQSGDKKIEITSGNATFGAIAQKIIEGGFE